MPSKPNLLVTFHPVHAGKAREEIRQALREVGELEPTFLASEVEGLALLHLRSNPKNTVHSLRQMAQARPEMFQETVRWVPLEHYGRASPRAIQKIAKQFDKRIDDSEEWAIHVEKRHSDLHTKEILELVAKHVNHPHINLDAPQKEARFEIIGQHVGAALLSPAEKFNTHDLPREPDPPPGPQPPHHR